MRHATDDERFMDMALAQARAAVRAGEWPFGAVLVDADGSVIATAHDTVETDDDFTSHAETMLVKHACTLASRDLSETTLYTTVEPCPMCFTTAWLARVGRVVWGATMADVASTGAGIRELAVPVEKMNELGGHAVALTGGVLRDECVAAFKAVVAQGGPRTVSRAAVAP